MQSPSWEANNHLASQEIPCLLWNPKIHYHVHKSPPLVPILNQANPVNNFQIYFFKIHSNIILRSKPRSSKWSLSFRFSNKNHVHISHPTHAFHMPRQSHPPWLEHPNSIWCNLQIIKLLIMNFLQPLTTASLLCPNIFLSTQFSNTHTQSMSFP